MIYKSIVNVYYRIAYLLIEIESGQSGYAILIMTSYVVQALETLAKLSLHRSEGGACLKWKHLAIGNQPKFCLQNSTVIRYPWPWAMQCTMT